MFQHTAARRRLPKATATLLYITSVSTHSRAEAAAVDVKHYRLLNVSFNTQPPEGGCTGRTDSLSQTRQFQHTAARRRLRLCTAYPYGPKGFQHTAARRRLPPEYRDQNHPYDVSTHSRPKAAAAKTKSSIKAGFLL